MVLIWLYGTFIPYRLYMAWKRFIESEDCSNLGKKKCTRKIRLAFCKIAVKKGNEVSSKLGQFPSQREPQIGFLLHIHLFTSTHYLGFGFVQLHWNWWNLHTVTREASEWLLWVVDWVMNIVKVPQTMLTVTKRQSFQRVWVLLKRSRKFFFKKGIL